MNARSASILHISDTHFGTQWPAVVDALVALAHSLAPDLVVLGGDVTQRARRAQFRAAVDFLRRLPAPVLAVPGNHDIPLFDLWSRCLRPYGNFRQALGPNLQPSFETPRLLVLGVNSTRPARHTDGELSDAQVRGVARRLRAADPAQLRVVVLHHPMRSVTLQDTANLVKGHEQAARLWAASGADLVLGGHIHLPYIVPLHPDAARRAWAVQAGTAVSHRLRAGVPNSVNHIVYPPDGGCCVVEQWDCAAPGQAFARACSVRLDLDRVPVGPAPASMRQG